ncbi:MAG: glycerophosphodiester phosphodiesterase, partial [Candidatus Latescibacteria bacterium]|nr:glycerophosphodiester phosphodiesterase [Candidatus Latescibacterota bacterium]
MRLKGWHLALLLLVAVWLLAALKQPVPLPTSPYFAGQPEFLVIAHRGGRGLGPESTLPLFRQAVDLGVDVLEFDVRQSADGVLILLHDETVDRTTEGSGRADQLTLAQLKALDAGYRWTPDGQTFPCRGQGYTIPTLEEVFRAFPQQHYVIEIKPDEAQVARALGAAIRDKGMAQRVMVASFHGGALEAFRAACPEVATSASSGEATGYVLLQKLGLDGFCTPIFAALQLPERSGPVTLASRGFVQDARAHG